MASWVSRRSSASPVAAHSSLRRSTSGFNGRFRRSVPRCAAKLTQDVDVVQHVVVRGDTLGKIASTYGVEPGNLVGAKATLSTGKARTIGSDGTVLLGETLNIPLPRTSFRQTQASVEVAALRFNAAQANLAALAQAPNPLSVVFVGICAGISAALANYRSPPHAVEQWKQWRELVEEGGRDAKEGQTLQAELVGVRAALHELLTQLKDHQAWSKAEILAIRQDLEKCEETLELLVHARSNARTAEVGTESDIELPKLASVNEALESLSSKDFALARLTNDLASMEQHTRDEHHQTSHVALMNILTARFLHGHNASKALNGATKVDQSGQNGVASSEQQLSKNGEKAA